MRIELATSADDLGLRSLLREGVMGDRVRLGLEREPDYFQGAVTEGDRHQTIVLRRRRGAGLLGMGSRSVRRRYVDGRSCLVPYLGSLRVVSDWTGSLRALQSAYKLCGSLRRPDETPYALTSIVADNGRARRLLERGLPGLPRYRRLGRQHTIVLPVGRRPRLPDGIRRGTDADTAEICDLLQRQGRRFSFHPVWDRAELARLRDHANLLPGDFLLARRDGRLVGCVAVWDQRPLRQTVIQGYDRGLSLLRPFLNAASPWLGTARLPAAGSVLASGFLSHLAVTGEDASVLSELLDGARWLARCKELDWLAAGFGEGHPQLVALTGIRGVRRLTNILYLVCWSDTQTGSPVDQTAPPLALEVATL